MAAAACCWPSCPFVGSLVEVLEHTPNCQRMPSHVCRWPPCSFVGSLEELLDHMPNCQHMPSHMCRWESCRFRGSPEELVDHEDNCLSRHVKCLQPITDGCLGCTFLPIACPRTHAVCSQMIPFSERVDHFRAHHLKGNVVEEQLSEVTKQLLDSRQRVAELEAEKKSERRFGGDQADAYIFNVGVPGGWDCGWLGAGYSDSRDVGSGCTLIVKLIEKGGCHNVIYVLHGIEKVAKFDVKIRCWLLDKDDQALPLLDQLNLCGKRTDSHAAEMSTELTPSRSVIHSTVNPRTLWLTKRTWQVMLIHSLAGAA
jgi:hypothetical protein